MGQGSSATRAHPIPRQEAAEPPERPPALVCSRAVGRVSLSFLPPGVCPLQIWACMAFVQGIGRRVAPRTRPAWLTDCRPPSGAPASCFMLVLGEGLACGARLHSVDDILAVAVC